MSLSEEENSITSSRNLYVEERIESSSLSSLKNAASIRDTDVLCGRGKESFNHVGNKRFREIVTRSLERYNKCESAVQRSQVVQATIDSIHAIGGRFLKNEEDGTWEELTPQQCRDKVGHAIRDASKHGEGKKRKGGGKSVDSTSVASDDVLSRSDHTSVSALYVHNNTKRPRRSSHTSYSDRRMGSTSPHHDMVAPLREDSKVSSNIDALRPSLRNMPLGGTFGMQSVAPNTGVDMFLPRRTEANYNAFPTADAAVAASRASRSSNDASRYYRHRPVPANTSSSPAASFFSLHDNSSIDDIESHEELLALIKSIFGSGAPPEREGTEPEVEDDDTIMDVTQRTGRASRRMSAPSTTSLRAPFAEQQQQRAISSFPSLHHPNHHPRYEAEVDPLMNIINMALGPPSSDDSSDMNTVHVQSLEPIQETKSSSEES